MCLSAEGLEETYIHTKHHPPAHSLLHATQHHLGQAETSGYANCCYPETRSVRPVKHFCVCSCVKHFCECACVLRSQCVKGSQCVHVSCACARGRVCIAQHLRQNMHLDGQPVARMLTRAFTHPRRGTHIEHIEDKERETETRRKHKMYRGKKDCRPAA